MTLFDSPAYKGHESVHAFQDEKTGLKAIIAVHSTARGPAAGGCRMWPYASSDDALRDVLNLSRGMSYKNAVADLELGGGKSVIIGDSRTQKTPELFEAFGRCVESLGGRYWTAEDVGVSVADIMNAAKSTQYAVGIEGRPSASGDPSPVTAEGVFRGIKLASRHGLGAEDLNGLTVAIQGVGHVGAILAGKLHAAGARLIISDVNQEALNRVASDTGAQIVAPDAIFEVQADVFAPCALGGAINPDSLSRLKARVIAGGANNQLVTPEIGRELFARGFTYAPDYVINGGGIINVASEVHGIQHGHAHNPEWVEGKLSRLMQTLDEILARSKAEGRPTHELADDIAEARIRAARP
jgi:leucine dehydrogenase